jgi:hypothetical protein
MPGPTRTPGRSASGDAGNRRDEMASVGKTNPNPRSSFDGNDMRRKSVVPDVAAGPTPRLRPWPWRAGAGIEQPATAHPPARLLCGGPRGGRHAPLGFGTVIASAGLRPAGPGVLRNRDLRPGKPDSAVRLHDDLSGRVLGNLNRHAQRSFRSRNRCGVLRTPQTGSGRFPTRPEQTCSPLPATTGTLFAFAATQQVLQLQDRFYRRGVPG